MAKADITLMLRGGVDELGVIRYRPGQSIQGTITIITDDDVKCNHLYVRLVWHTEGRGTRYQEKVDEINDKFQTNKQNGQKTI